MWGKSIRNSSVCNTLASYTHVCQLPNSTSSTCDDFIDPVSDETVIWIMTMVHFAALIVPSHTPFYTLQYSHAITAQYIDKVLDIF